MNLNDEEESYLIISLKQISPEALEGLIEEFILREGTDYGHTEISLKDKKKRIYSQIQAQDVKIVYSSKTEDCTLIKAHDLPATN